MPRFVNALRMQSAALAFIYGRLIECLTVAVKLFCTVRRQMDSVPSESLVRAVSLFVLRHSLLPAAAAFIADGHFLHPSNPTRWLLRKQMLVSHHALFPPPVFPFVAAASLMALKPFLDPTDLTGWSLTAGCSQWKGVTCRQRTNAVTVM